MGNSENQQQGNLSNAMIYPLDELLVLDEHTRNLMGKERIRFDVATMFQEMATNDIRLGYIIANYLPNDKEYKYMGYDCGDCYMGGDEKKGIVCGDRLVVYAVCPNYKSVHIYKRK